MEVLRLQISAHVRKDGIESSGISLLAAAFRSMPRVKAAFCLSLSRPCLASDFALDAPLVTSS
jgi:hypothetical protein